MDFVYQLYKNVKTYQDLLDINIQYFNGEVDEIITTSIAFYENHDIYVNSKETLIELTYKKVYYCSGGPSIFILNDEQIIRQRSDICFLIDIYTANLLKDYLFSDNRIYVSMYFPNGNYIDNMPLDLDILPISYVNNNIVNIWKRNYIKFSNSKEFTNLGEIENILSNLVECSIISVDFDTDESVENILLSHVNNLIF
jgi:hypothetical protein